MRHFERVSDQRGHCRDLILLTLTQEAAVIRCIRALRIELVRTCGRIRRRCTQVCDPALIVEGTRLGEPDQVGIDRSGRLFADSSSDRIVCPDTAAKACADHDRQGRHSY